MKIIETHCHLDMLKKNNVSDVVLESDQLNIEKIITIAVEPSNLDPVIELSKQYEKVYCSQGIHPHDAKDYSLEVREKIKKNTLGHKKVVAIGEMGLDYHYNNSPKEKQIEAFESQIELAIELDKPIIIHTRDADDDTITILRKYSKNIQRKGVLHSYTSGKELAELAISEGFFLGFNGISTFKNAQNVRDIIKLTPIEKILIETDSPFLAPIPNRGKENTPLNLPYILDQISLVKELKAQEAAKIIYQNSLDLFFS